LQTFYEHENSLMSRNTGAIALRPTGDTHNSHYFLNINSGRRITHNYWTILPMRTEVITTIQQLAVAEAQRNCIHQQRPQYLSITRTKSMTAFQILQEWRVTTLQGWKSSVP